MKKATFVMIVSLLTLLFFGCSISKIATSNKEESSKEPPALKVLYQDKSIAAHRGSYHWTYKKSFGKKISVKADGPSPTGLGKDTVPLNVSSGSILTLDFASKPSRVEVDIYKDDKVIDTLVVKNGKIEVPDLKGQLIFGVSASWEQGNALYAFLVDVNN